MDEVSKCGQINRISFVNLYFPIEDANFEIWVVNTTVSINYVSSPSRVSSL